MRAWSWLWLFTSVLAGCGSNPPRRISLILDVRTDLVPGLEFEQIRSERWLNIHDVQVSEPLDVQWRTLAAGSATPFRAAQFVDLEPGGHVVLVSLLGRDGALVVQRLGIYEISRSNVFTITITRDCRGIDCDEGGPLRTCFQASCVAAECTPSAPEHCPPPTCTVGSTCVATAPCVQAECTPEGACLQVPSIDGCNANEWCNPDRGCEPLPSVQTADGGSADAAVRLDAGPGDASLEVDAGLIDAATLMDGAGSGDATVAVDAGFDSSPDGAAPDGGAAACSTSAGFVWDWVSGFGSLGGGQSDLSVDLAVDDARGRVSIVGWRFGSFSFGGDVLTRFGGRDVFVANFDSAGRHRWSKSFGDTLESSDDVGHGVATDSDGHVYITGTFFGSIDFGTGPLLAAGNDGVSNGNGGRSDIFLAKFDPDGGPLWAKAFGGLGDDEGFAVAADSQGNVFISGTYYPSIEFGGQTFDATDVAYSDMYIASFGARGEYRWAKSFGDWSREEVGGLAVGPSDNLFVTGLFGKTINFGGAGLRSTGGEDVFVASLDSGGNHLWSTSFGSKADDEGTAVAVDAAGRTYATGTLQGEANLGSGIRLSHSGSKDAFLVAFDESGRPLWAHSFGDVGGSATEELGTAVGSYAACGAYVGGSGDGSVDLGAGVLPAGSGFLGDFTTNGSHQRSAAIPGTPFALASGSMGALYVTGWFSGVATFGSQTLTSRGAGDIFLGRLLPP